MPKSTVLEAYKANFETLCRASDAHDLALAHCRRKDTNEDVAVVIAVSKNDLEEFVIVPLAIMIEGDPYETLYSPDEVAKQDEAKEKEPK